ncbi:MAG: hypothetical protein COA57_05380 [Flavobacteriales bacterium]|nr:MAG: hypothetical protein COA57_05380 [Flavobacteriales bacterium]
MNIQITKPKVEDAAQLAKICKQTYTEAYGYVHQPKVLQFYLNQSFNNEIITTSLKDEKHQFLIAKVDGEMVGYAHLFIENKVGHLERIYILRSWIGKGIGKILLQKIIQVAANKSCSSIQLSVWTEDERAIEFYKRAEFEITSTKIRSYNNEKYNHFIMKKSFPLS